MGNCCANKNAESDSADQLEKKTSSPKNRLPDTKYPSVIPSPDSSHSPIFPVSSEPKTHFPLNTLPISREKTLSDISFLEKTLSSFFLYSHLTKDLQNLIIREIKYLEIPPFKAFILQDKISEFFWIINSGKVKRSKGKNSSELKPGDCIGQMSLISNSVQTSTYSTLEPSSFWVLDRVSIRSTLHQAISFEYQENKSFIERVSMFKALTKIQKELLLSSVTSLNFHSNDIIVSEGDKGDLFYIIKEGQVACKKNQKFIRSLTVGEYFGEQAFLYGTARTATVSAVTPVKCLVLSGEELAHALGSQLSQIIYRNSLKIAFEKSQILSTLSAEKMNSLISGIEVKSFENGQVVIEKGTRKSSAVIVLLNGKLNEQGFVWEALSLLGEEETVKGGDGVYLEIRAVGRVDLTWISQKLIENIETRDETKEKLLGTFKKLYLFRSLSSERLSTLIENLKIEKFEPGSIIFSQGSSGKAFYLIKQGVVEIYKNDGFIRSINKLDYFGERALLFDEPRSATVKTSSEVECWVLKKVDFLQVIDERVRNLLFKRILLQDSDIELTDLLIIKKIGSGMLGDVFLTMNIKTSQIYALKSIDRHKIDTVRVQDSLALERKILMQIDHCFILKLIKTFKDQARIYFLLEYVRGADLFDVIRELGLLSSEDARFYTSCLLIILEHLHEREIVYRDLKPENVMTDEDGYPKLIDFGTAKIVSERTYSMIGTPHYMAPEVILGKGYNTNADYWSLGVMVYEFICGGVPFGENENESYKVFEKILNEGVCFPHYVTVDGQVRAFVEKVLNKNPALRVGAGLRNLNWLKNVDWDGLIEKKYVAPFVAELPNLKLDISKAMGKKKMVESGLGKGVGDRKSWDYEF